MKQKSNADIEFYAMKMTSEVTLQQRRFAGNLGGK